MVRSVCLLDCVIYANASKAVARAFSGLLECVHISFIFSRVFINSITGLLFIHAITPAGKHEHPSLHPPPAKSKSRPSKPPLYTNTMPSKNAPRSPWLSPTPPRPPSWEEEEACSPRPTPKAAESSPKTPVVAPQ